MSVTRRTRQFRDPVKSGAPACRTKVQFSVPLRLPILAGGLIPSEDRGTHCEREHGLQLHLPEHAKGTAGPERPEGAQRRQSEQAVSTTARRTNFAAITNPPVRQKGVQIPATDRSVNVLFTEDSRFGSRAARRL